MFSAGTENRTSVCSFVFFRHPPWYFWSYQEHTYRLLNTCSAGIELNLRRNRLRYQEICNRLVQTSIWRAEKMCFRGLWLTGVKWSNRSVHNWTLSGIQSDNRYTFGSQAQTEYNPNLTTRIQSWVNWHTKGKVNTEARSCDCIPKSSMQLFWKDQ